MYYNSDIAIAKRQTKLKLQVIILVFFLASLQKLIMVSPDCSHFPWLFPDNYAIPLLFQVFYMSGYPVKRVTPFSNSMQFSYHHM